MISPAWSRPLTAPRASPAWQRRTLARNLGEAWNQVVLCQRVSGTSAVAPGFVLVPVQRSSGWSPSSRPCQAMT